jgi:hypothetical protein
MDIIGKLMVHRFYQHRVVFFFFFFFFLKYEHAKFDV